MKRVPGVEVELVDGRVVARKGLIFKPSVKKILAAVREATPAGANP